MNTRQNNPKFWEKWESLAEDCPDDGTLTAELKRDFAGKFHLIFKNYVSKCYFVREVTPQQAAVFCLKRFIPAELHSHFAIK